MAGVRSSPSEPQTGMATNEIVVTTREFEPVWCKYSNESNES